MGATQFESYAKNYRNRFIGFLQQLDLGAVATAAEVLMRACQEGRRIYLVGNGGSAAIASHFAIDFLNVNREWKGEKPFRVTSLADNLSVVTALGNDEGFENIFVRQLERYFEQGDVLIAISASGHSPNIINAVEYANRKEGITVGLVGFDGGVLKGLCRHLIHVATPVGEYGHVEDSFAFLDHLLTTYFFRMVNDRFLNQCNQSN
ncbi:MAG: SIS domain-containing protein [Deltaproteobacteria bacterium]|nr:SIS domain-containing protein [Deltaproteobacteria bacterium]